MYTKRKKMKCQDLHFILSLRGTIQESTTYQVPRKEMHIPLTHLFHHECILSLNY